jgi:hypothetical protein
MAERILHGGNLVADFGSSLLILLGITAKQ